MKFRRIEEERIKKENICMMELVADKHNKPVMRIVEDATKIHELPLSSAFEIYRCNEFLRSLNLGYDPSFINYNTYGSAIWHCMDLLTIKKVIEKYGHTNDVTAAEVFVVLLDKLSIKVSDHSTKLEAYVLKAIEIIKNGFKSDDCCVGVV